MTPKQYGHFDDAQREYVITNPATPFPWINYLGNEDFFHLSVIPPAVILFTRMPSSAASHATATTACRWITAAGIFI